MTAIANVLVHLAVICVPAVRFLFKTKGSGAQMRDFGPRGSGESGTDFLYDTVPRAALRRALK